MNYFTNDMLLELQGEAMDFIRRNFNDCTGYKDFIDLVLSRDTSEEIILNEIDRGYLNNFIKYKELYAILDDEEDLNEIIEDECVSYFMDCNLLALLDYFTEITFIELLSYVYIYKYNDIYYAVWDI